MFGDSRREEFFKVIQEVKSFEIILGIKRPLNIFQSIQDFSMIWEP